MSAISGAAFAQSSVTISGRLNLGANSITTTNGTAASTTARDLTGAENTRTTSRLSFSGVEDLGGGLKAGFDITYNLSPSERATNPALRQSNVSLSGGFGTVAIGSFMSNAIDAVRGYNPGNFAAAGGDFQARQNFLPGATSNAIVYSLPAMSGFKANVALLNQNRVASTATPVTAAQKISGFMLGAEYAEGPLSVKAAHGNVKVNQVATVADTFAFDAATGGVTTIAGATAGDYDKVTDTAIGASYNLGYAVPYMTFETSKATSNTPGSVKNTSFDLGAKFPMGALTPFIAIGTAKLKADGDTVGKTKAYQLGATYDLSKRTSTYVSYGQDQVKDADGANLTKRKGYSAGIVHMF